MPIFNDREYHLFSYYGAEDADRMIILMGSATDAAREAIDYLNAQGQKVGMISVHLYRPFSVEEVEPLWFHLSFVANCTDSNAFFCHRPPIIVRNALGQRASAWGDHGLRSPQTSPQRSPHATMHPDLPSFQKVNICYASESIRWGVVWGDLWGDLSARTPHDETLCCWAFPLYLGETVSHFSHHTPLESPNDQNGGSKRWINSVFTISKPHTYEW